MDNRCPETSYFSAKKILTSPKSNFLRLTQSNIQEWTVKGILCIFRIIDGPLRVKDGVLSNSLMDMGTTLVGTHT